MQFYLLHAKKRVVWWSSSSAGLKFPPALKAVWAVGPFTLCRVFRRVRLETLQVHQGYSLGRFGRLGVKSAALVQFGEFVCRLVTEMCVEMFFFSEVDSAFESY